VLCASIDFSIIGLGGILMAAMPGRAGVVNGGFETGDLTGWEQPSDDVGVGHLSGYFSRPPEGAYAVVLTNAFSGGFLTSRLEAFLNLPWEARTTPALATRRGARESGRTYSDQQAICLDPIDKQRNVAAQAAVLRFPIGSGTEWPYH